MKVVPVRLQPGADLRQALEAWMGEQQEQAGCMISAVRPRRSTASWRSSASPAPSRPMAPTCTLPSQAAAAL
jgi:hypothetical protein